MSFQVLLGLMGVYRLGVGFFLFVGVRVLLRAPLMVLVKGFSVFVHRDFRVLLRVEQLPVVLAVRVTTTKSLKLGIRATVATVVVKKW